MTFLRIIYFTNAISKCSPIFKKYALFYYLFISNTFISNDRLKLTINQAKTKQHPEAELFAICYLEIIRFLHPRYHPKILGDSLQNAQKTDAFVLMRLYD